MLNELTQLNAQQHDNKIITIYVEGKQESLILLQQLRALPNRRAVFKAQWKGQYVVAKIFMGKHRQRDFHREQQGIAALGKANIKTPNLLAKGVLVKDEGNVLLIEFLEPAHSLSDAWNKTHNQEAREFLLEEVVTIIAKQHQAGLTQHDIHLSNFLLAHNAIYTIDGGGVDIMQPPTSVDNNKAVNNLGLFFAQWPPKFDEFIEKALHAYNQERQTHFTITQLITCTYQQRQKRLRHFLKKIYRECSEFVCQQSWREFRVVRRDMITPGMMQWLDSLDDIIAATDKPAKIKNGESSVVTHLEHEGHFFIVKRYNIKGFWHAVSRCLRPSRAWVSWRNGNLLRFLDINTPLPVALIEKRYGPLRKVSYIVTQAIDGLPLDKAVQTNVACIPQVAQLIEQLAIVKISHGDMKASNFMVDTKGAYLIDLDATKQHHSAWFFKRAFTADIERFMRNWEQLPEVEAAFRTELKKLL